MVLEGEIPSLVRKVLDQHRIEKETEASILEAREQTPNFYKRVEDFFTEHEDKIPTSERLSPSIPGQYELECKIPTAEGDVEVSVIQRFQGTEDYIINMKELDHILVVSRTDGVIQSKAHSYRLGRSVYRSDIDLGPAWELALDKETLAEYSELMGALEDPSTEVTAKVTAKLSA